MRRHVLKITLATAFAASTLVAAASPAVSGSTCAGSNSANAPDGRVRLDDGQGWIGIGSYPEATLYKQLAVGEQVTATLRWRNVSASPRTIRVTRLEFSYRDQGFSVKYLLGGVDVRSAIKGHGLKFTDVPPDGSTRALKIVITRNSAATSLEVGQYFAGRYGGSDPQTCDFLGVFAEN